MNAKQIKKWEITRKLGRFRFVVIRSFVGSVIFSLFFNLFLYFFYKNIATGDQSAFEPFTQFLTFILFFGMQLFINNYSWDKTEEEYQKTLEQ
jgi:hypothetical protein